MKQCVFCKIIAGKAPSTIVREWPDAIAFLPLDPVVPDGGHVLVVPRVHVADATVDSEVTGKTMACAAELAAEEEFSNLLTSVGRPATQSVFHLHIHVVRRKPQDGLMLPWGTTGNPHAPHACKRSLEAEEKLAKYQGPPADRAHAPHCDASILHAPGECEYCDQYPEWQQYRTVARLAFTNETSTEKAPCPSVWFRSPEMRDLWHGNVAGS